MRVRRLPAVWRLDFERLVLVVERLVLLRRLCWLDREDRGWLREGRKSLDFWREYEVRARLVPLPPRFCRITTAPAPVPRRERERERKRERDSKEIETKCQ